MKVRHPEFVLAAATIVCLPMVPGLLSGGITAAAAAERFLLALVGCWFLGSILSWVINTYTAQSQRAEFTGLASGSIDRTPNSPQVEAEEEQG